MAGRMGIFDRHRGPQGHQLIHWPLTESCLCRTCFTDMIRYVIFIGTFPKVNQGWKYHLKSNTVRMSYSSFKSPGWNAVPCAGALLLLLTTPRLLLSFCSQTFSTSGEYGRMMWLQDGARLLKAASLIFSNQWIMNMTFCCAGRSIAGKAGWAITMTPSPLWTRYCQICCYCLICHTCKRTGVRSCVPSFVAPGYLGRPYTTTLS